jgi:outer membrane protein, multidrug efflux system
MNMRSFPWFLVFCCLGGCALPRPRDITTSTAARAAFPVISDERIASETEFWRSRFPDPMLQGLVAAAIRGNSDLRVAVQRVESARATMMAARGSLAPTLGLAAGAGLRRFGLYTMDGAGNLGVPVYRDHLLPRNLPDYSAGLEASWELDLWGKLRARKAAALQRVMASEAGRQLVQTGLISEVACLYFDLVATDSIQAVLEETTRIQSEALATVTSQREAGLTTVLAEEQFSARLESLRAMQIEGQQEIIEIEASIRILVGNPAFRIERSTLGLDAGGTSDWALELPADLLDRRPDVREAASELAAASADVRAVRAAFLPSVSITGALGLTAFRPDLLPSGQSMAYSLAGGLAAPLINRSAIKAEYKQAGAAELEALATYLQSVVNAVVEVQSHQARLEGLARLRDLKARETEILTRSTETAAELFERRRATYLELLAAKQAALDARLEYVDILRRIRRVQVGLYRALGGG